MNIVALLIWLLVIGVVVGLVYYVCDAVPVPPPLNKIIKIVAMVVAVIVIIMLLLSLIGAGPNLNLRLSESGLQRAARLAATPPTLAEVMKQ